ncbi:MAG: glycerol-3-phosphate 1-O-acyltransferase PlsY [Actinobacteria bacterium]|nr:glycerol-3-phosphate 1-O-acyltransferase PlsY [Actinomycetota bacterium]
MSTGSVLTAIALVVFGYLVGSLSPSVWLGRIFKGIDIREHGSGNAGTTNAFRLLGTRLGIAVLLADFLKGVIPVVVAQFLSTPLVTVIVAFVCVLGHNYSIFLRGRGGKGVATGAGAATGMMPIPMVILVVLFAVLSFGTRIISIASITCTILLPIIAFLFHQPLPYIVGCCLMSLVVLWAHRRNIVRLLRREEPRAVFPWNKKPAGPAG